MHAGVTKAAQAIAALRASGAHRHDPVRFCFIEALARRAAGHRGAVRQVLDAKLAAALQAYSAQASPPAPAEGGAQPQYSPLADLVLQLDRQTLTTGTAPTASPVGAPAELKALRHFRSTWAKLSVDRQLSQANAEAPENAGPLNSHRLVLRALQCMQGTAPAYLSRFMSSVDSLLWLDQASVGGVPAPGHGARNTARTTARTTARKTAGNTAGNNAHHARDTKRKPGRSKAGT